MTLPRHTVAIACGLFLLLPAGEALAQSADATKPKQPMLSRMPDFSTWRVTHDYKLKPVTDGENAGVAISPLFDRPASVLVTRTKTIYREEITWLSGKTSERWIFGGMEFKSQPGSEKLIPVTRGEAGGGSFTYDGVDFEGLDWMSPETFKRVARVEDLDGQEAFLFETPAGSRTRRAFLSLKEQRPLLVDDGWVTRIYTYLPPPQISLTPPETVRNVAKRWQAGREAAQRQPSPP